MVVGTQPDGFHCALRTVVGAAAIVAAGTNIEGLFIRESQSKKTPLRAI